jgi:hypothetical protein
MWLLSWIREGKQHKMLFNLLEDVNEHIRTNFDIGMLIEHIEVYKKPTQAPKKEPTYTRLVPLSDTITKD